MKKIFTFIGKFIGKIIHLLIHFELFLRLYNYLFEKSSHSLVRLFVKFVSLPNKNGLWYIHLPNGKKIKTQLIKDNQKTFEFALSYKWHNEALNEIERILNDTCPLSVPFVDVGSNLGLRSIYSLSIGRKVLFIEPNKEVNDLNINRCKFNGFENFELFCFGASDKIAQAEFTIDESSYNSSLELNSNFLGENTKTEIIEISTLDELLKSEIDKIEDVFFKIDVEGHELNVLKGASMLIGKFKPTMIIEVNEKDEKYDEFYQFCIKHSYRIFEIGKFQENKFLKEVNSNYSKQNLTWNDFLIIQNDKITLSLKSTISL